MKAKCLCALFAILFFFSALSEDNVALTIGGEPVSFTEAEIYILNAEEEYSEIAQYYEDYLGIDYWMLTYTNGMTISQSVKSDVFDEIKAMNIFYIMAKDNGLMLTPEEKRLCRLDAQTAYQALKQADQAKIDLNDLALVFEKQLMADRMYSVCLEKTNIDQQPIIDAIDKSLYITYEVEYLFRSYDDFDAYGGCIPLTADKRMQIEAVLRGVSEADDFKAIAAEHSALDILYGCTSFITGDSTIDLTLLEAAKTLNEGELSGIITTDLGLFLIKLTGNTGTQAYEQAVAEALYAAREAAFSEDKAALIRECRYEINISFWNTLAPGAGD